MDGGTGSRVTSVSPEYLLGASLPSELQIFGTNFTVSTTIQVFGPTGAVPCTNRMWISQISMTCELPAMLPLGWYSVRVSDNGSDTLPNAFFSMGDPVVWFDASNALNSVIDAGTVAILQDSSRFNRNISGSSTATLRPVLRGNGPGMLPTLQFTSPTYLWNPSLSPVPVTGSTPRTLAVVATLSGNANEAMIFGFGASNTQFALLQMDGGVLQLDVNGGTNGLRMPPRAYGTPFYFVATCPGFTAPLTSCALRLNGNAVTASPIGTTNMFATSGNGLFLGKSSNNNFVGDLSEVVLYDTELDGGSVSALELHLMRKFDL